MDYHIAPVSDASVSLHILNTTKLVIKIGRRVAKRRRGTPDTT